MSSYLYLSIYLSIYGEEVGGTRAERRKRPAWATGRGAELRREGNLVEGSGFRVQGSGCAGCRVQGSGGRGLRAARLKQELHRVGFNPRRERRRIWHLREQSGFRVQGSGFGVQGSGFRVQGSGGAGCRVQGASNIGCRGFPTRIHSILQAIVRHLSRNLCCLKASIEHVSEMTAGHKKKG